MSTVSPQQAQDSITVSTLASTCSSVASVSGMAIANGVQRIENELRCPACRRYLHRPVLLPCGHSMCYSCTATTALLPSTDPMVVASVQAALLHHNPASTSSEGGVNSPALSASSVNQASLTTSSVPSAVSDSDRMSVASETDSGVVVNTSRPGSYLSNRLPVIIGHLATTQPSHITHGLFCPACNRVVGLYESDALKHMPRNRALERLILKFVHHDLLPNESNLESQSHLNSSLSNIAQIDSSGAPLCQLCEDPTVEGENEPVNRAKATQAVSWCEQCQVFYCQPCRERCHPARGPLMRHLVHSAYRGLEILRERYVLRPPPCVFHPEAPMRSFCLTCQTAVCQDCLATEASACRDLHGKHDVHSLSTLCKSKKTELSQALQTLSERARTGTDCIQRIRANMDAFSHQLGKGEEQLLAQVGALITLLEAKQRELTESLQETRDAVVQQFRDQINQVTCQLTRSTSLIQFCIEILKESDHSAFLVVAQSLILRAQEVDQGFKRQLSQVQYKAAVGANGCPPHGRQSEEFVCGKSATLFPSSLAHSGKPAAGSGPVDLFLDTGCVESIRRAITDLRLQAESSRPKSDEKSPDFHGLSNTEYSTLEVPGAPVFLVDECISERNIITLVWQPCSPAPVERYTLELDDGADGHFRKVYRGCETICTVEGLHFRSIYRARVKAHNQAGESAYSECLPFQTSDLTWFHLDATLSSPEILLTNGNCTATSQSVEDHVALGSTALSRGSHYWEFTVDRCEPGSQPAFGVAYQDCNKETMLGLDMRGWSAYFNQTRSWFLHNGEHFERTDGGVQAGSVVGVRLDCQRGTLSYYLNDEPHGPIAFAHLPPGVYYPAVSVSRGCQVTLHVGLEVPSESEESDEDCSPGSTQAKEDNDGHFIVPTSDVGPKAYATASHDTSRQDNLAKK